jgi:hypothetical protein
VERIVSTLNIASPARTAARPVPAVPYVHPALAAALPLAGALAARRPHWKPRELLGLTELLVRDAASRLRQIAQHDPVRRWYARLALTEEVEVWLLCWTPEQRTRPHDHGGASGAFTVLDGALAEMYRDGPVRSRRVVLAAGGRSAFGPERVHQIVNPDPANATSVHAYSPPLLPLGELSAVDAA